MCFVSPLIDEGLGSSGRHYGSVGSGSAGSGSVYLSDSQDWVVSPSCSPDESSGQHNAISPMLAEETFRYMSKCLYNSCSSYFYNNSHIMSLSTFF